MKKRLLPLMLLLISGAAQASPYFRLNDPRNPTFITGAFFAPQGGGTDGGAVIPVFVHKAEDGFIILPGEDWSPLAICGGGGASNPFFGVGISFNAWSAIKEAVKKLEREDYSEADNTPQTQGFDLSISISPMYINRPMENFKGYFRIVAGPAWRFK